jgi:type I restriction enzyme M protein
MGGSLAPVRVAGFTWNGWQPSAVYAVFVKRDDDYFEFKPEIDSKGAIREVVGDVDDVQGGTSVAGGRTPEATAKVISQLEHWWDKYRVSLKELDTQVAEAESVMKGYLVELGYE